MERQRTKIGARILSEQELNMILPNADSVFEQIEVFRRNIADTAGQQTNNIGIIGCRGAGKTSILKTFSKKLEEKNKGREGSKDIMLPLIVPENMSSGTTLMDVVLGMLKSIVDERKKNDRREMGECIYAGRDSLEKKYNNLVKQYCYIKKDYRDILIQQFTTEQNYVDKTKEVFKSDTEFISLFREFISFLLDGESKAGEKGDALLFLFIDDIDLSTTRCMDVVRALLSYLSLPRIVTFISGDMNTFEEALTLDFLRQEKALSEDVFGKSYLSAGEGGSSGTLLERKKELAYEYLKKIIPPAYRKRIKYWSLEERGSYQVTEEGGERQRCLAQLLTEATGERVGKGYFSYKENGEMRFLGPVFHMFDETSRGLNNVYNVLQELCEEQEEERSLGGRERQNGTGSSEWAERRNGTGSLEWAERRNGTGSLEWAERQSGTERLNGAEKRRGMDRQGSIELGRKELGYWRLIEAIVDSKPLYAKYKDELLQKIIIFGQDEVRVDFENACNFLGSLQKSLRTDRGDGDESEKGREATGKGKVRDEREQIADGRRTEREEKGQVEEFAIFTLVDFASLLFLSGERQTVAYDRLKCRVIMDYLVNTAIDGKIADTKWTDYTFFLEYGQGKKENFPVGIWNGKFDVAQAVLRSLLQQGDFMFCLYFVKCLGREEVCRMLGRDIKEKYSSQADVYKAAYALVRTIGAMVETEGTEFQEYLADIYERQPEAMRALLDNISLDPMIVYGERLVPDSIMPETRYFYDSDGGGGILRDIPQRNFDSIDTLIYEAKVQNSKRLCLWAERENQCLLYWIYYGRKIKEEKYKGNLNEWSHKLLHAGVKGAVMDRLRPVMSQYEVKELKESSYPDAAAGDQEKKERGSKRREAIKLIDKKGLWGDAYVRETVGGYLENEIKSYIRKISNERLIFNAGSLFDEPYFELMNCYKGTSGTAQIIMLLEKINNVLRLMGYPDIKTGGAEKYYLALDEVLILQCLLEEFLDKHYRIRYGKKEARKFLGQLKELPLANIEEGWEGIVGKTQQRTEAYLKKWEEELKNKLKGKLTEKHSESEEESRDFGSQDNAVDVLDSIAENVRKKNVVYSWGNVITENTLRKAMEEELRSRHLEWDDEIVFWIMYLAQKKQIEEVKKSLSKDGTEELSWDKIEETVSWQDFAFLLHSRLRYLQANESDAAKAGTEAEAVALLARLLIDSETIADSRTIGNVYGQIGGELGMTEDEFGELFPER